MSPPAEVRERTNSTTPQIGMLATVRNRRGIIASVDPWDGNTEGRIHLVRVEYTDTEGPPEDTIVWEREHGCSLVPPLALPRVDEEPPMPPSDFDALLRAARWSTLTPFVAADQPDRRHAGRIAAPFIGAVQAEDFQLVPLLKALGMSRVSVLLADDVGLGKTVEAGLVLTELLLRRRIRKVLVLCPASLREQWRQEMADKFSVSFDLIDRSETYNLQRTLGPDANPWRTFQRAICSYHYLKQADILEQFLATCRLREGTATHAQLPWDLLIVDEAHNLTPGNFGEDSDLTQMLRHITPYFEHKLFLTATPHNGRTRCFSGLLELLDPVRFTRKAILTDSDKRRVEEVVVRRLKREINALDDSLGRARRFPVRYLHALEVDLRHEERRLSKAVEELRSAVRKLVMFGGRGEQLAGSFAIEVLNKRLLSCPATFAESWFRFKDGIEADRIAAAAEVAAARRSAEEDIDDDPEREGRSAHAVRTVGAWLKPLLPKLVAEVMEVDAALAALGLTPDHRATPVRDARLERTVRLIDENLRQDRKWIDTERLIIFTEYKTTLDHLNTRLRHHYKDDGTRIRTLYGGGELGQRERDAIKAAFNDPLDPVRILLATDVASEGLNLQETARLLLHYDVPWNPSRLEQRNGRIDRHGQGRDVRVYHFDSREEADVRFLSHVVQKVHDIREDLGSAGEVFDAAFQRRFIKGEDEDAVRQTLDAGIAAGLGSAEIPRSPASEAAIQTIHEVAALGADLDLSPDTLCETLESALGIGEGHPRLEGPDARGRMRLLQPIPSRWQPVVDDSIRLQDRGGAIPGLIFNPRHFLQEVSGRPVFRPTKDTVLLHLGHPMFRQALASLARARFPGGDGWRASRWTVRHGDVPVDADALILISVEELAVNELREPIHHWTRTWRLPLSGGALHPPLDYIAPASDQSTDPPDHDAAVRRAQELWSDARRDAQTFLRNRAHALAESIGRHLDTALSEARTAEQRRFASRIDEVERERSTTSLAKLEAEIEDMRLRYQQRSLLDEADRELSVAIANKEEELDRRRRSLGGQIEFLKSERVRILTEVLPRRFRLHSTPQIFPVSVEIRLPKESR